LFSGSPSANRKFPKISTRGRSGRGSSVPGAFSPKPLHRHGTKTLRRTLSLRPANGGKARTIASPKLDPDDCAALNQGTHARNDPQLRAALERPLQELEHDLAHDTLAALAWRVADGLLDFRIVLPTGELDGDFHDKFGVFGMKRKTPSPSMDRLTTAKEPSELRIHQGVLTERLAGAGPMTWRAPLH